jgi:putative ABC transport system permease protein
VTEPTAASGRSKVPASLIASQARTSVGALAISAAIVAVAVFLTAAVPVLAQRVTTDQLRASLAEAGPRADVVVHVPLGTSQSPVLELVPDTADTAAYIVDSLNAGLPAELDAVLGEPITTIVSPELVMGTVERTPAKARFAYVAQGDGPLVEWVQGSAPGRTGSPLDVLDSQLKTTIEVGVSRAVADVLGAGVGDTLPVQGTEGDALDVIVTGIFAPVAAPDAFATVPTLLNPSVTGGADPHVSVGLLAAAESIPAARLGAFPATMLRYFTYPVRADAISAANAQEVATVARGIASGKQVFEVVAEQPMVVTRLDVVLDSALAQSNAAAAQASVLLLAIVTLVALTQLLAASVMIAQRSPVLGQLGARGASVRGVGAALGVESAVVAGLGVAIGLGLQQVLVPGAVSWAWVATPIVVAVLAAPLLGMRDARRRRLPLAAQSRRGRALATPTLRRLTASIAVALAAVVALLSLRARGTAASEGSIAADLLVLAAPALSAVAVGVGLAWALPYLASALRSLFARARGAGPLLTAARMRAPGTAVVALVLSGAIAAMAASVGLTARHGVTDAAWDVVGADAVAIAGQDVSLPELVSADGDVTWAAAAPLGVGQLAGAPKSQRVQVVAVDAAALAQLAASLPDGHPDAWQALAEAPLGDDGSVPMLQSADLVGVPLGTLSWGHEAAPVYQVGSAPDLPGTAGDSPTMGSDAVVIVDRAALATVVGEPIPVTVIWASGPDAGVALESAVAESDGTVTTLDSWRAAAQSAPVTKALTGLFAGAIVVALGLAALGVGLLVAAGGRERARAMGRLRVVGLSQRRTRMIARGEVSGPVLIASAVGVLAGLGLVAMLSRSLGLESVTAQDRAPQPVLAWWTLVLPLILGGFAWLAVGVGLRLGRAPRLGEVLRVG